MQIRRGPATVTGSNPHPRHGPHGSEGRGELRSGSQETPTVGPSTGGADPQGGHAVAVLRHDTSLVLRLSG